METTSGNNIGNYGDIQVELTYISISNPPRSSRPAFGQHNPVYVPAPGPARQAGAPAQSPDGLTAAHFAAQSPQLSVSIRVSMQTSSGYGGLNCKAPCDTFSSSKLMRAAISSNRSHSSLMAPNNMAEVFYYSRQYEEWFFACPFHSPRQSR